MKSSLAYAALCVSCALSGVSAATEDTAIFAYYAQQNDPMESGFNKRVFNTVEYTAGSSISLVGEGDVTLHTAGLYRISGTSIVTWHNPDVANDLNPPSAYSGYAELKYSTSGGRISTGTMSNAAWAVPSTFDTFLDVTESLAPLNVSLWHQAGTNVTNVWLGLNDLETGGFTNNVFARLVVQLQGTPSTTSPPPSTTSIRPNDDSLS